MSHVQSSSAPERPFDPGDRWVPVDRRFLGLDRATLVPAVVVVALAGLMGLALPAINSAVPYDDRVAAGDVMELRGGITFEPAVGWGISSGVREGDAPTSGAYPTDATVEDAGVSVTVKTGSFTGDARALLAQIKETTEALDDTVHIDGDPVVVTTDAGDRGVMARFAGPSSDGALAAFVFDGTGVQVIATGPADTERQQAEQVARMIATIRSSEEDSK
jgi:hypothetical protein